MVLPSPTKLLFTTIYFPMHATCPAIPSVFDLEIVNDEYKSRSFSFCSFLQPSVSSFLLHSNTLLSTFNVRFSSSNVRKVVEES
jgi:hypothetical protein